MKCQPIHCPASWFLLLHSSSRLFERDPSFYYTPASTAASHFSMCNTYKIGKILTLPKTQLLKKQDWENTTWMRRLPFPFFCLHTIYKIHLQTEKSEENKFRCWFRGHNPAPLHQIPVKRGSAWCGRWLDICRLEEPWREEAWIPLALKGSTSRPMRGLKASALRRHCRQHVHSLKGSDENAVIS